jgi:hypothetical protein
MTVDAKRQILRMIATREFARLLQLGRRQTIQT